MEGPAGVPGGKTSVNWGRLGTAGWPDLAVSSGAGCSAGALAAGFGAGFETFNVGAEAGAALAVARRRVQPEADARTRISIKAGKIWVLLTVKPIVFVGRAGRALILEIRKFDQFTRKLTGSFASY